MILLSDQHTMLGPFYISIYLNNFFMSQSEIPLEILGNIPHSFALNFLLYSYFYNILSTIQFTISESLFSHLYSITRDPILFLPPFRSSWCFNLFSSHKLTPTLATMVINISEYSFLNHSLKQIIPISHFSLQDFFTLKWVFFSYAHRWAHLPALLIL